MIYRLVLISVVLAFTLIFSLLVQAQEGYQIKLTRPIKAGANYRVSANGRDSMSLSKKILGGQALGEEKSEKEFELIAVVTTLERSREANYPRRSIVIEKLLVKESGSQDKVIPNGTVIIASLENGKTIFKIDGKDVDPAISKALADVFSLSSGRASKSGGPSDDEIFGTQEKKRVGDSWSVNTALAAKDLSGTGIIIDEQNIKGTTTLEKVSKVGKEDCLFIKARINMSNVKPAEFSQIPNLKVEKAELGVEFSGVFPTDLSIGRLEDNYKMSASFNMLMDQGADSPMLSLTMLATKELTLRFEYLSS